MLLLQGEKVMAGCIAGFMSCIAVYPLDMLRTCASMSGAPKGFRPLVRSVLQTSGPRGFYRVRPLIALCCYRQCLNICIPVMRRIKMHSDGHASLLSTVQRKG